MQIKIKRKAFSPRTVKEEIVQANSNSRTNSELKGKLFVFTGPSGAGKTTLAQSVLREFDFLKKVITCTSRTIREGEKQDKDYHFVSKEKFEEYIAKDELLEYATVYGNYYGSLKSEVTGSIESGKSVLMVVDVQGALAIKQKFPSAISVFIKAPSLSIMKKRLIKRGTDSMEVIDKRIKTAKEELKLEHKFDNVIINDDLHKAILEVNKLIVNSLKQ